jgi:hypothetical protein
MCDGFSCRTTTGRRYRDTEKYDRDVDTVQRAGGDLKFLNTANGATVFTYNTKSTVQGEVTVSNGIVYARLANGNLAALGP